jgi:hypothetical protein
MISKEWGGTTFTGWKAVPIVFLRNYAQLGITAEESLFIILVHSYVVGDQRLFPKAQTIAKEMGRSVPSVRSYIRSLRKKGFLTTTKKRYHQEYDFSVLYQELQAFSSPDSRTSESTKNTEAKPSDYQHPNTPDYQDPHSLLLDRQEEEREKEEDLDSPSGNPDSRLGRVISSSLAAGKNRAKSKKSRKQDNGEYRVKRRGEKPYERKDPSKYNCNDLGAMMRERIRDKFDVPVAQLTMKDRGQLKKLIKEFGAKETVEAAEAMITRWEELRGIIPVNGYPTVQVLFGFRRTIVPWSIRGESGKKPTWGAHFDKEDERPEGQEEGWDPSLLEE